MATEIFGKAIGGKSRFPKPITTIDSGQYVADRFDTLGNWGNQVFNIAKDAIFELGDFELTKFNFDFTNPLHTIAVGTNLPPAPDLPSPGSFTVNLPDIPDSPDLPSIDIDLGDLGDPPDDLGPAPVLNFPPKPVVADPVHPGGPPQLIDVEAYIPDSPDLEFPELPELDDIPLPTPPEIIAHEFDSPRPTHDIEVPHSLDLESHEIKEYNSDLLAAVQAEVSRMLEGGTGLPPAVEQMLFDRSRAREDEAAERAIMEAHDDWAARGFSLPSGIADRRIRMIRQENQSQRNALNRELTIYASEKEIENLQFAVSQGIALESLTSQIHLSFEQLRMELAQRVADLLFEAITAKVEIYNAEVSAYRVDAEVYRERIQAELTKVELFRTELEAARLRGDLNQQKVDLYRTRLEALNTLIGVYVAELEAANTIAQVNESKIRTFEASISAYATEIRAKVAEFEAWQTEIEGELGKIRGYEAEARGFSARAAAYESGVSAKLAVPQFEIEKMRALIDEFRAKVDVFSAGVDAERTRIGALGAAYSAQTDAYSSVIQRESARIEGRVAEERIKLEDRRLTADRELSRNELGLRELTSHHELMLQQLEALSQVASQLSAATMSAVNASASISESGSASNSWSASGVWSGEM
jgi:hypothetical protein